MPRNDGYGRVVRRNVHALGVRVVGRALAEPLRDAGHVLFERAGRGDVRAGVLNFSYPGAFEPQMADIAAWFREHPPERAG